ncbi:hypothetical protein CO709_25875 [Burkholderia thailandensis]|nr:hypothetical protein CO709_25875 [Burkholderia thailandensis]
MNRCGSNARAHGDAGGEDAVDIRHCGNFDPHQTMVRKTDHGARAAQRRMNAKAPHGLEQMAQRARVAP